MAGLLVDDWTELVAGGARRASSARAAAAIVVAGALRRGGTRGGLALLVAGAAARHRRRSRSFPSSAILDAVALPALACRLRRTQAERYAGLRTLARD